MLHKELRAGRIAGPFDHPPFQTFICSPLGARPKKETGKIRIIHDLSYPKGAPNTVNASIPQEHSSVQFLLLDHVVHLVQLQGRGCFLAKTDIQEAYRLVPIHPDSYYLLGFQYGGQFYYDKVLPMGLSPSCAIFEKFSTALQWALSSRTGVDSVSHIIDDFIFVHSSKQLCLHMLNSFTSLCSELGVPIKHSKTVPPSQLIEAHGILIDTVKMQLGLPQDKLQKCISMLHDASSRRKVTLRQLQSLIGNLNFACKAIRPGRAFLRRLIGRTIGVTQPYHKVYLTNQARADIHCWLQFLSHYNGTTLFLDNHWTHSEAINLYSDAASTKGYSVVLGDRWVAGSFPPSWDELHITLKELYPITIALLLWGPELANKKVRFHTDNEACVHIINSQSSRDPQIMALVRLFVQASMAYNILFRATHVPGKQNVIADLLSRFQFQKARQLAPWLQPSPTALPAWLTPDVILQDGQPNWSSPPWLPPHAPPIVGRSPNS